MPLSRRLGPSPRASRACKGLLLVVACAAACRDSPAMTAEDAYLLLAKACEKGDPARLFDALDTPTQWSIESVHHNQREMRKLILGTYPPDERDRALARIPAAAEEDEEHPRRYFRRLPGSQELLAQMHKRIKAGTGKPVGTVNDRTRFATVWREGGSVFAFAEDKKGRWGLAELRDEWEHAKLRSTHDLETVRQNAALYRGAAAGTKTSTSSEEKK